MARVVLLTAIVAVPLWLSNSQVSPLVLVRVAMVWPAYV